VVSLCDILERSGAPRHIAAVVESRLFEVRWMSIIAARLRWVAQPKLWYGLFSAVAGFAIEVRDPLATDRTVRQPPPH